MSLKAENYIPVIQYERGYYSNFPITTTDTISAANLPTSVADAVGDGATNDAPAIQSAIDAVASATNKGIVFLPAGRYRLNTPLVPKSGVTLRGAGIGKTILLPYGTVSAIQDITTGSSASPLTDMVFEDFEIDGSNQTGTPYNVQTKGFFILYLKRCIFRNLYIHDTAATGLGNDYYQDSVIDSLIVKGCGRLNSGTDPGGSGIGIGIGELSSTFENLVVTNCHAIGNKRFGIFVETQNPAKRPLGTIITNNVSSGNQYGIGECGGTGTIIANNIVTANTKDGISMNPGTFTTPTPGRMTVITGNSIYSNTECGIKLSATSGLTLSGYKITGNRIWSNDVGFRSTATNVNPGYITITGNDIHDHVASGIEIGTSVSGASYKHVVITNNVIWNNGKGNGSFCAGIRIAEAIADLQILNNRCFDDQGTQTQVEGLLVGATRVVTGGKIEGNDFRDNKTRGITLSGTLTSVDVRNNAGYNPIGTSAITVTASPFTYTAGNSPEDVYISGGTVSSIAKNSSTLFTATDKLVHLEPRQAVVVTYSQAPTMVKDVL